MHMHDFANAELSARDMDQLFYALDGALKIRQRHHFYHWSQGGLQAMVPHETLVCAWGDIGGSCFKYEVFTGHLLDADFLAGLADPIDGLLTRAIRAWQHREHQTCIYTAGNTCSTFPPDLCAHFARCGYTRVIAHGAREARGTSGSFFVFINGAARSDLRDAYFLELLLPHLHLSLHRIGSETLSGDHLVPEIQIDAVLSGREREVLRWVRDGKTNSEIAQIIDLSPLTVKNHMQRILRKLKVTNRAQAVAKAIAARVIPDRTDG